MEHLKVFSKKFLRGNVMFGWINENDDFYGKSVYDMVEESDKLSDSKLFAVLLAENGSCPSNSDCARIVEDNGYVPDGLNELQKKKLKAIRELLSRYSSRKKIILRKPEEIFNYTRHYAYEEQENLVVLSFNGNGEVLNITNATKGTADRTVVHPREVFKECIRNSGVSIIMVHNHPSGQLIPSEADKMITKSITEAGKILGIKVLDHIIISQDGYFSFREKGIMD